MIIVVTAHEGDRKVRARRAPTLERLHCVGCQAVARVQEVAQYVELCGASPRERIVEPGQSGLRGAARHGYTLSAERRSLAPVHVGDDERATVAEQHGSIGQQLDINAGD